MPLIISSLSNYFLDNPIYFFGDLKDIILVKIVIETTSNKHAVAFAFFVFLSFCTFICVMVGLF